MPIPNSFIFVFFAIFLIFQSCSSSKSSISDIDDPDRAYNIAKAKYDKKDYLDAIDDFNLFKIKFNGSNRIDQAIYYLGMSYYKREEYILAEYEFQTLIKNYPASKLTEDARYMQAMCYYGLSPAYNLDQTYTNEAIESFRRFLEDYPQSRKAAEADKRIMELRTKLAQKDLKSAELYAVLDQYESSLVYYDNVLLNFFDTQYADDALYGKIQTLISMENTELAKDAIEQFENEFSSSPLLSKVLALRNKIR